jgi:hypothetical protein
VRGVAERAYFRLCLTLGRLLRASRYATTRLVHEAGEARVRKRRLAHAPLLVALGDPLVRVLDTGVRVLPQRAWEARERLLHGRLRGAAIRVEGDGTLVLPYLTGRTLAALLEDPALDEPSRARAVQLAVAALAAFHALGFTHGDAMAENVMVDLDAGAAHWFDFETVHDARRPLEWRRADDLRALLFTALVRTAPARRAATLGLVLDAYGDARVVRELAASVTAVPRRALPFHLGQAPSSYREFREIARLLRAHAGADVR